jgi:hypothetical protein
LNRGIPFNEPKKPSRISGYSPTSTNESLLFGLRFTISGGLPFRHFIKADTTDAVDAEGISSLSIAGALSINFDKRDKQPKITETARMFLSKLGVYMAGRANSVKLVRV